MTYATFLIVIMVGTGHIEIHEFVHQDYCKVAEEFILQHLPHAKTACIQQKVY